MKLKDTSEYKAISVEESVRLLETSTNGLTEPEATKRIEIFGHNEVVEKKKGLSLTSCRATGVLCLGC